MRLGRFSPDFVATVGGAATAQVQLNNPEEALKYAEIGLGIATKYATLWSTKAAACAMLDRMEAARAAVEVYNGLTARRTLTQWRAMPDDPDAILTQLPARLKEARRAQGLSLDAVAKLSGVSRSMVSQIERGESSPTVATLWNLTRALQVDFAGLLDTAPRGAAIEVMRRTETPLIENRGAGCTIRILSAPEAAGKYEVYEITLNPEGHLTSEAHRPGAREQLTVIEGEADVFSGDARQHLSTGDTARYAVDVPHKIAARRQPLRAFLIVIDA